MSCYPSQLIQNQMCSGTGDVTEGLRPVMLSRVHSIDSGTAVAGAGADVRIIAGDGMYAVFAGAKNGPEPKIYAKPR